VTRLEIRNGKIVRVVEVCAECGYVPQAPQWDQCYGCGKTNTERTFVPTEECEEVGLCGVRWRGIKMEALTPAQMIVQAIKNRLNEYGLENNTMARHMAIGIAADVKRITEWSFQTPQSTETK
jgi:hypothetical protein